jgi:hypothetical protein
MQQFEIVKQLFYQNHSPTEAMTASTVLFCWFHMANSLRIINASSFTGMGSSATHPNPKSEGPGTLFLWQFSQNLSGMTCPTSSSGSS